MEQGVARENNRIRRVTRDYNHIYFHKLNHPSCTSDFIRMMYDGIQRGFQEFVLHWDDENSAIFPNACVPIASIIEYYKQQDIRFDFDISAASYLRRCCFDRPQALSAEEIEALYSPFDALIKYSSAAQVASYTQKCVDYISHHTMCESGTLTSLIWCINEVMDNVLVHSGGDCGYVMAQFHVNSNHIVICVADTGVGIYNSLKNSSHHPARAIDALTLSIQEGIGDGNGQGNGLYGLHQIIRSNGGRLTLTSGPASLMLTENLNLTKYDNLPYLHRSNHGTIVDFQLDLNCAVDITSAFSSIGGFDGFDIRIDDMLQDNDSLLYDIFENCEGTATRDAGRLLRQDILNTIKRTGKRITLDFGKITTASSSFIDELLAKMIVELGVISFNQLVTIRGMNETVKFLCERSIYMRIASEWNNKDSQ